MSSQLDITDLLAQIWQGHDVDPTANLEALTQAWNSGKAIPRLADKTITPMAGARVDLEQSSANCSINHHTPK